MEKKKEDLDMASYGDLSFQRSCPFADYDSCWCPTFNDRMLINVTACYESTILFAAREGWINSVAPVCTRASCYGREC